MKKTKQSIITGIKSFIQSWCDKHYVITSSFSECKRTVISALDEKISHLSIKLATGNSKNILGLRDEIITEELKMLQNKFAVAPIDKASGNVTFVGQRHYVQVLINEIGQNNVNKIISACMKVIKPVDKIV